MPIDREEIESATNLINSKGFEKAAYLLIIGFVIWNLTDKMSAIPEITGKMDTLISKIENLCGRPTLSQSKAVRNPD